MRRARLWLPPLLYMAAIFLLSAQSHPLPIVTEHVWDKLLHTIEYAGLGLLVFRARRGEGLETRAAFAWTIVIVSLYGGSDEWHQSFVPSRSSDLNDWFVDMVGGAIGVMGFIAAARLRSGYTPRGFLGGKPDDGRVSTASRPRHRPRR